MTEPSPLPSTVASNGNRVRVLVIGDSSRPDNELICSLSGFDELDVVARTKSGEEALNLSTHVQPQVILVDHQSVAIKPDAFLSSLHERCPHSQLIVLAQGLGTEDLQQMCQAARGACLFLGTSPKRLQRLISTTSANAKPPPASRDTRHPLRACPDKALNPKERTVLNLMARGLNDHEIGDTLKVNELTARFHTGNVISKLGTASRAAALNLALERNLVQGNARQEQVL